MNAPFTQAVLWPGTTCPPGQEAHFEEFIATTFDGVRSKFIGCFLTKPDIDELGNEVPDTGGRSDLLFAVHEDDVGKFAVPRFAYGMRWVDDVIANEKDRGEVSIYVQAVHDLCSWSGPSTAEIDEILEDDRK